MAYHEYVKVLLEFAKSGDFDISKYKTSARDLIAKQREINDEIKQLSRRSVELSRDIAKIASPKSIEEFGLAAYKTKGYLKVSGAAVKEFKNRLEGLAFLKTTKNLRAFTELTKGVKPIIRKIGGETRILGREFERTADGTVRWGKVTELTKNQVDTIKNTLLPTKKAYEEQRKKLKELNKEQLNQLKALQREKAVVDKHITRLKKLNNAIYKNRQQFKGWALSVLFAGWALENFFKRIITSSISTFMSLSEETNSTRASVTMLQAAFQTLSYSVGSAFSGLIEAVLPFLISIIEKFTDFTDRHPKFVASFLAIGFGVGFLFKTFGQLIIGIDGVIDGLRFLKGVIETIKFTTLIENIKSLPGMFSKAISKIGSTFSKLGNIISTALSKPLVLAGLWVGSILALGFVLFALKGKFGTWCNALKAFVSAFLLAITGLVGIAVDAITMPLKTAGKAIAKLMRGYNKLAALLHTKPISEKLISSIEGITGFASITKKALEKVSVALDKYGFNVKKTSESTGNMWEDFKKGIGYEKIVANVKTLTTNIVGVPVTAAGAATAAATTTTANITAGTPTIVDNRTFNISVENEKVPELTKQIDDMADNLAYNITGGK